MYFAWPSLPATFSTDSMVSLLLSFSAVALTAAGTWSRGTVSPHQAAGASNEARVRVRMWVRIGAFLLPGSGGVMTRGMRRRRGAGSAPVPHQGRWYGDVASPAGFPGAETVALTAAGAGRSRGG